MNNIFRLLVMPRPNYGNAERSRARMTLLFSDFFFVLHFFALIFGLTIVNDAASKANTLVLGVMGLVLCPIIWALIQSKHLRIATLLLTIYLFTISNIVIYTSGVESNFLLVISLPLIYTALIYGVRGILVANVLLSIGLVILGVLEGSNLVATDPLSQTLFFIVVFDIMVLTAVGGLLALFFNDERRTRLYADKLVMQLRATAEVAQTTSTILELDELIKRSVNYIRDRFAFYHVQIFLIDEDRRFADLAASTGEVGEALLQRGHRLAVGSQSIIGRVTLLGTPISAQDTTSDPVHRVNELLPETRSELALPLIAGDQVIGALDVQSTRANAFVQEDIDSLQIMATQISIAIRNAQLFAAQKTALMENRRLFLEAENSLREIERLNQRLTGEAWDDYLRLRKMPTIGFTVENSQLSADVKWSDPLRQAVNKRRPVITTANNHAVVAVPIEVRGQTLGAVEVEMADNVRQADLLDMVQSVAQRLALSIDNARLFEQAQEVAQQELEVNTISAKIQGVSDIDDILRTVVTELGRALGAERAAIRLGSNLSGKVSTDKTHVLSQPYEAPLAAKTPTPNGRPV